MPANQKKVTVNKFPLRLMPSVRRVAEDFSQKEGVSLNQFINVAVAEKVSALRTSDYFRERAALANIVQAKRILKRSGRGNPPVAGDELSPVAKPSVVRSMSR